MARIPEAELERLKREVRVERLQGLGVLRASGHERLNGSVVVPVFDEAGGCKRSPFGSRFHDSGRGAGADGRPRPLAREIVGAHRL